MKAKDWYPILALHEANSRHVDEWRQVMTERLIAIEDRLQLIVLILQGTTHQGTDFTLEGDGE